MGIAVTLLNCAPRGIHDDDWNRVAGCCIRLHGRGREKINLRGNRPFERWLRDTAAELRGARNRDRRGVGKPISYARDGAIERVAHELSDGLSRDAHGDRRGENAGVLRDCERRRNYRIRGAICTARRGLHESIHAVFQSVAVTRLLRRKCRREFGYDHIGRVEQREVFSSRSELEVCVQNARGRVSGTFHRVFAAGKNNEVLARLYGDGRAECWENPRRRCVLEFVAAQVHSGHAAIVNLDPVFVAAIFIFEPAIRGKLVDDERGADGRKNRIP